MQHLPNLLIVDDSEINLLLLERIINKIKVNVIKSVSGNDALNKTRGLELALAIIDVRMPGMNGYELAVKLNEERNDNKIPIIFVTSNTIDDIKIFEGYNSGAVDFIFKPIDNYILQCKIGVFLELFNQKLAYISSVRDIKLLNESSDKLQKANESLIKSENKYRSYIDNAPDGVFTIDETGRFIEVNESLSMITGYSKEEFIEMSLTDLLPQVSLQNGYVLFKKNAEPDFSYTDFFLNHKNKSGRWCNLEVSKLSDTGFLGFIKDITSRKQATDALLESEEKYRLIIGNSHDIIYTLTSLGIFTYVSPVWTELLGHPVNQVIGKSFREFVDPEDVPGCLLWLQKVVETGQRQEGVEYRVQHANGKWYWHTSNAVPFRDESNNVIGYYGIASDITERKHTADLLLQTHHNYETFFNAIDEFLFILDEQKNIIHINSTVVDRLGYSRDEFIGKSIMMVYSPKLRDEADRLICEMLSGLTLIVTIPLMTKFGTQIPVETKVKNGIWDSKSAVFVVTKDISRLKLSEEKFSKLFYINPSACWLNDCVTGKYIEVNDAFYNLLGFVKNEVIGKTVTGLGILTTEKLVELFQNAENNESVTNANAVLKAKNGSFRHVQISSEEIFVQDKKYRYTVIHDITDLKRTEIALRESEEINAEAQRIAHIGSWKYDTITDKIKFSKEMCTVFGINPETFDGKRESISLAIHPDDITIFNKSMSCNITSGDTTSFEYRTINKSGSIRNIYAEFKKEFDNNNLVGGIGIVQDITERKIAEKEKNALETLHQLAIYTAKAIENERKSISRELHDDLGQVLTAVKIHLGMIIPKLLDIEVVNRINQVIQLVSDAIKSIQGITKQLRPEFLDDLGLEAAINWYSKEFSERNGIEVILGITPEIVIPSDVSLTIFRIVQESLTNISRHSKATKVYVGLSKTNRFVNLRISDNGIGITRKEVESKESFGILSMKERTASLGGTFEIYKENKQGTVIKIIIPLINSKL